MVGAIVGGPSGHWQLLLCSAAAGFALGVAILAAVYLAPLIRVRLAADQGARWRLLEEERERLRRLGDDASVREEHGLAGARELRTEAELRGLLLMRMTEDGGRAR